MNGGIRDKLNQAPPWVTYTIVGVVVVAAVGFTVFRMGGGGTEVVATERHFYCLDCQEGFTASPEQSRELMQEAAKDKSAGPGMVKCPKCGKIRCVACRKCTKCGTYFVIPEKGMGPTLSWRDTCPQCGFSEQKDNAIRTAFQQKKEGTYDPDRLPDYIRDAVKEAEESGEYDHLLK